MNCTVYYLPHILVVVVVVVVVVVANIRQHMDARYNFGVLFC